MAVNKICLRNSVMLFKEGYIHVSVLLTGLRWRTQLKIQTILTQEMVLFMIENFILLVSF